MLELDFADDVALLDVVGLLVVTALLVEVLALDDVGLLDVEGLLVDVALVVVVMSVDIVLEVVFATLVDDTMTQL